VSARGLSYLTPPAGELTQCQRAGYRTSPLSGVVCRVLSQIPSLGRFDSVRSAAINSWLQHVTVVNRKRSVATHPIHIPVIATVASPETIPGDSRRFPAIPGDSRTKFRFCHYFIPSVAQVIPFAATTYRSVPNHSSTRIIPFTGYALTSPLSASIRRSDHSRQLQILVTSDSNHISAD